ncbi:MAG: hypothetical protein ACK47E_08455, partial [Cyclobacteriaceae bacterium]
HFNIAWFIYHYCLYPQVKTSFIQILLYYLLIDFLLFLFLLWVWLFGVGNDLAESIQYKLNAISFRTRVFYQI